MKTMARPKKLVESVEPEETTEEVEEVVEEKSLKVSVLGVFKGGNKVREFSLEVHGKAFKDNAEEYAKKIGGSVEKIK